MEKLFDVCNHLEFRPKSDEVQHLKSLLFELEDNETTPEEMEEYIHQILTKNRPYGRHFEPYCKKLDSACVIIESAVMSMRHSNGEGLYQPLMISVANWGRISKCDSKGIPTNEIDRKLPLDMLVLRCIKLPDFPFNPL